MFHPKLKAGYLLLSGLNSFATVLYFYYLYFYMRTRHGFGNRENLLLAAGLGFLYIFAAISGGRFAQKHGYFRALRLGFGTMTLALALGSFLLPLIGLLAITVVCVVAMCFTWPTLEALLCEHESRAGVQRMVGIYNLVWASTGSLAYFTGGAMLEKLGLRSLFLAPLAVIVIEWLVTLRLQRMADSQPVSAAAPAGADRTTSTQPPPAPAMAKTFLRLAWLINPFCYVAINSAIPVIPTLASRLDLTPMFAGFFCSVWLFARTLAFLWLWLWPGWHYRFGWLAGSYLAMIGCFSLILLVPNLWVLMGAQILFGLSLGLIYYSSLFYSMDVGETKGEHGGLHEAAIGAGNCVGPAIGATALYFFPRHQDSGTWAVSGLLIVGLAAMVVLKMRK